MKPQMKVYHSSNEIEDICTLIGLCQLLEMNEISFSTKKLEEYYLISHETFNYEDAIYIPIEEKHCYTCNSSSNKTEKLKTINGVNNFFEKNIGLTLQYFSTNNEKLLKGMKKQGSVCNGSFFNTKGIRASTSPGALTISSMKRSITFLGWINGTNYITNDDVEINAILIPKKADRILRPYEYKYLDKETNEMKIKTHCNKKEKKSDIIRISEIYVNTATEYLSYLEGSDGYEIESVLFMVLTKSAKKPLPNKYFKLPVYNWSIELYKKFSKILGMSYIDYDVREMTARFIFKPNLSNFHKLINIFSKKNQLLELKFKEDIISMYNNKVQEIHNNETVKRLGKGLNYLLYKKKGFEILIRLYTVRNLESLAIRIREIEDQYIRVTSNPVINNEELISLINLINTPKEAAICANAIISYARVFYAKKKDDSNNEVDIKKEKKGYEEAENIADKISIDL